MADLDLPSDGSDPFAPDITQYEEWFRFSMQLRRTVLHTLQTDRFVEIVRKAKEEAPEYLKPYLEQQESTLIKLRSAHDSLVQMFNVLIDQDKIKSSKLMKQAKDMTTLNELIAWAKASKGRQERFAKNIASIQNSIQRIQQATEYIITHM